MFKYFLIAILISSATYAEDQIIFREGAEIYPIKPNGRRDWQLNHYRIENGQAVPIRPNGRRDWNANVYQLEESRLVTVRPDGRRDWNSPVLQK